MRMIFGGPQGLSPLVLMAARGGGADRFDPWKVRQGDGGEITKAAEIVRRGGDGAYEAERALRGAAERGHGGAIDYWASKAVGADSSVKMPVHRFLGSLGTEAARMAQRRIEADDRIRQGILPRRQDIMDGVPEATADFLRRRSGSSEETRLLLEAAGRGSRPALDHFVREAVAGDSATAHSIVGALRRAGGDRAQEAISRIEQGRRGKGR